MVREAPRGPAGQRQLTPVLRENQEHEHRQARSSEGGGGGRGGLPGLRDKDRKWLLD